MVEPYSDAMDMAYDEAVRLVSRGLARLGVPDAAAGLRIDYGTNGQILAYRTRWRLDGLKCEPDYLGPTGDPAHPLDQAAVDELDRLIHRHARRVLRDRALERAGIDPEARDAHPAWTFTIHRLARAWFTLRGVDPFLAVAEHRQGLPQIFRIMADNAGMGVDKLIVEDGRMDFGTIDEGAGISFHGHGRPCVNIEREVPETVVAAMPGRRLHEVLQHPAVKRAGAIRIEDAVYGDGLLTLILEDIHDFVRRPPTGADRRWRRIPFKPRPGY